MSWAVRPNNLSLVCLYSSLGLYFFLLFGHFLFFFIYLSNKQKSVQIIKKKYNPNDIYIHTRDRLFGLMRGLNPSFQKKNVKTQQKSQSCVKIEKLLIKKLLVLKKGSKHNKKNHKAVLKL